MRVKNRPQLVRPLAPNARQQFRQPFECQLIARVADEPEIGGDVLDVRLFVKANAAGDAEGNLAPRQLQLQFQGVEVGAVKHRHVVQGDSALA